MLPATAPIEALGRYVHSSIQECVPLDVGALTEYIEQGMYRRIRLAQTLAS